MSIEINNESEEIPWFSRRSPCARKGRSVRGDRGAAHESSGARMVRDLVSLIQRAEADDAVQVLVFKSVDADYFIPHVDVTRIKEYREEAAKLTGEPSIALLFRHLSASRLVTIAQIEGRVRGAGSEFILACDMRFAALESAIFSQPEQAFGLIPERAVSSTWRASWAARGRSRSS